MSQLLSPDNDTFSTPPTTPGPGALQSIKPSLSRRSSRPTSIQTGQTTFAPNIILEKSSPQVSKVNGEELTSPIDQATITPRLPTDIPLPPSEQPKHNGKPRHVMDSPCFVHSQLDKGASLSEWLQSKQAAFSDKGDVGVARSLQRSNGAAPELISQNSSPSSSEGIADVSDFGDDDSEDYRASLTKQLAETAIGVREMSKQLG
jgi:NAD+ kinase